MAEIIGIRPWLLIFLIIQTQAKDGRHPRILCPSYGIQTFTHEDCNRYYECSNGILFSKYCEPDQLFDAVKKRCLKSSLAVCDDNRQEELEELKQSNKMEQLNLADIDFNEAGCPIDEDIAWKIPHKKCNKYYECQNGKPKVRHCPPKKLFNSVKLKCDAASAVKCEKNKGTEEGRETYHFEPITKVKLNDVGCPEDFNIHWRIPHHNCNQFYQCYLGVLEAHRCPINMVYNIDTKECAKLGTVNCGSRYVNALRISSKSINRRQGENTTEEEIKRGKELLNAYTLKVRAEEKCSEPNTNGLTLPCAEPSGYFVCLDGEAILKYCSVGLQYNHKIQRCDWFDDGADTYSANAEEACSKIGPSIKRRAMFPHENCNQYYKCVKGVPVVQYCQSGLLFDIKHKKCDWAASVTCGLRNTND